MRFFLLCGRHAFENLYFVWAVTDCGVSLDSGKHAVMAILCYKQARPGSGSGAGFDRDFNVISEKHQKPQEPVNGKT